MAARRAHARRKQIRLRRAKTRAKLARRGAAGG